MDIVKITKTIFITDSSGLVIDEQKKDMTMPKHLWDKWRNMNHPPEERYELTPIEQYTSPTVTEPLEVKIVQPKKKKK